MSIKRLPRNKVVYAEDIKTHADIPWTKHNETHWQVRLVDDTLMDFWPTSGKWLIRNHLDQPVGKAQIGGMRSEIRKHGGVTDASVAHRE